MYGSGGGSRGQIHDDIFHEIFKNVKFARELLQVSLTDEELAWLDLPTLQIEESSAMNVAGEKRRSDLVMSSQTTELGNEQPITIYVASEFKAQRAHKVLLQIMEYYVELCRRTEGVVIPIVFLCCEDEDFEPHSDYLSLVFKGKQPPSSVVGLSHFIPNFFCKIINLHKIPLERIWERAKSSGVAMYGLRRFRNATEEDVSVIIDKAENISQEDVGIVMLPLTDYYGYADKELGREVFLRVARNKEGGKGVMAGIEWSLDKARKQGMEKGALEERRRIEWSLDKAREKGALEERRRMEFSLDKAREKGALEERRRAVALMLARGNSDDEICDLLQLTGDELSTVKKALETD